MFLARVELSLWFFRHLCVALCYSVVSVRLIGYWVFCIFRLHRWLWGDASKLFSASEWVIKVAELCMCASSVSIPILLPSPPGNVVWAMMIVWRWRIRGKTSGYATMVHGRGCNPHRCTTTFANVEITLLWRHWWRHKSETIRDRQKRWPHRRMKSSELANGENRIALRQLLQI